MKKITALLLALVMALSLAACGSKDDSKQLVGTWQCALDLTEKMDEEMAANLGTEYTSEVPVSLYLTPCSMRTAPSACLPIWTPPPSL